MSEDIHVCEQIDGMCTYKNSNVGSRGKTGYRACQKAQHIVGLQERNMNSLKTMS